MNIMKNLKVIGYGLWVIGMLLVSMPVMAQDWQSTSTMQGSGSTYSSQVTGVGATGVDNMATTTTDSYSPANAGRRRSFGTNTDQGYQDEGSPVGDALIPLLLCACMYLSVRVILKRKRA